VKVKKNNIPSIINEVGHIGAWKRQVYDKKIGRNIVIQQKASAGQVIYRVIILDENEIQPLAEIDVDSIFN